MDIFLLILGVIFIVVGLAGCILPVIPGPPISFIALILLRFTGYVELTRVDYFNRILLITGIAALIVTILDYIVPVWGTKKYGGSRAGTVGSAVGLIIGIFFGPIGIIAGPFLGAVIGELLSGSDQTSSIRSGIGSLLGFLTGVVMKLIVSGIITWYFFKEIFVG